ncbi:MAG: indolepyruvate oxidoreductase subunit beta [Deltaproteobacteria bacterium]|nr:indolepyruvate oxidoreductase subunit beta [Deltaproteobacteria bacterium]
MKKDRTVTNIFLAGVGGQGTILASNIMGHVLSTAGFEVKKAEVHGMAQRGGDVVTHFRFGTKIYSPLIKYGDADYLIGFELLEGLRYINWLKNDGKVILNNQKMYPPAVNIGEMSYPDDIPGIFRSHFGKNNVYVVEGLEIARKLGNIQVANVVMVGAFSNFLPDLKEELWLEAIRNLVPERFQDLNIKAFQEGRRALG